MYAQAVRENSSAQLLNESNFTFLFTFKKQNQKRALTLLGELETTENSVSELLDFCDSSFCQVDSAVGVSGRSEI